MKKSMMYALIMVFSIIGFAQNGTCGPKAGEIFLSPMIGGHMFEGNQDPFYDDEDLDHALTFGLGLGYQFTQSLGTELFVNMTPTESDPGDFDVDVYPARLDLFYNLMPDSRIVPYVAAGLGTVTFSRENVENDTDFMVNYGLGVKCYMTDRIALRADVRHLIAFKDTHSNLLYTLGLVFSFGGENDRQMTEPVKEQAVVAEADTDGDGVVDSLDACADTPAGIAVDAVGCPLDSDNDGVSDDKDKCPDTPQDATVDIDGCKVVPAKVDMDSDGDGVLDSKDTCPETPKGITVDENGCPVDSDNDGVTDDKDTCPGTPVGATVNARGCWVIKGLYFESGKTTISSSSFETLNEIVLVLEKNPSLKLEIQGYTDNRGSADFNRKLSGKRAQAVLDYVVSKGISNDRMTAKGYGIENPIETNDTAEGRAMNRRVELKPLF